MRYYIVEQGFPLTVCPDGMLAIGEYAAAHDKLFSMNLSAPFLCQFFREPMTRVLPYVDILFGNDQEAEAFAKEHNFDVSNR
jgi:adenosine kinase